MFGGSVLARILNLRRLASSRYGLGGCGDGTADGEEVNSKWVNKVKAPLESVYYLDPDDVFGGDFDDDGEDEPYVCSDCDCHLPTYCEGEHSYSLNVGGSVLESILILGKLVIFMKLVVVVMEP